MKAAIAFLMLIAGQATSSIEYFRYERPVLNTQDAPGQSCLTLPADLFARASPGLADLRLYRDTKEVPFVLRVAAPVEGRQQSISPLDLGQRGNDTAFDAEMPEGRYTDVELMIAGQDFLATVTVSGSHVQSGGTETKLGSFAIYDLTSQQLGRSTVIHLPASDFRYLHFRVTGPIAPSNIGNILTSSLPATEPAYITVAQSSTVSQKDRHSILEFTVPPHVPVEQLVFTPRADPANFSRDVSISIAPVAQQMSSDAADPLQPVTKSATISRIHAMRNGYRIDEEHLAIDTPHVDFATAAKWTVSIDNGDDAPLLPQSVALQMMQRSLCFDSNAGAKYAIYYGDNELNPPHYDYATFFSLQPASAHASLGPEAKNPVYKNRPNQRPFTEKHPALLWAGLFLVIVLLAVVAVRSGSQTRPRQN